MKFFLVVVSLLNASAVYAQEVESEMPTPSPAMQNGMSMTMMFVILFLIFWFLVIRPQSNEYKAHQKFIDEIKRGDEVVTDSGIIGRVAGIEKNYILLEIANGVKVKVETAHIAKKAEEL